jgi:CDP-glycerol glycerophosphotransferase
MRAFVHRRVLPVLLRLLRLVLPTRRVVVVISGVPTEGNAIEVVRGLVDRYPGRIVWMDGPSPEFCARLGLSRVEHHGRMSRRGLCAYLTAEAVFLTHGAYGMARRVPRKLTINVWHGSGMKVMAHSLLPDTKMRGPAADLLVSGARVWGEYYAGLSDLSTEEVVYSANPRVDAFERPLSADQLAGLGIGRARFVLWMPTFRSTAGRVEGAGWSDSTDLDSNARLRDQAALVAAACTDRGIQLVLKAHPLDADLYDVPGVLSITDVVLEDSGYCLYQLLGASGGLLTDASSVWTDYLLLDRPIGFVFPDHAAYSAGRGVHPADIMDWLPGELLQDQVGVESFLDDVLDGGSATRLLRRRTSDHIGLAVPSACGSAAMLLDRLLQTDSRFARTLAATICSEAPTVSPRS